MKTLNMDLQVSSKDLLEPFRGTSENSFANILIQTGNISGSQKKELLTPLKKEKPKKKSRVPNF